MPGHAPVTAHENSLAEAAAPGSTIERGSLGPVVHVIDSGGMYGIERMLLTLLPRLKRHGIPTMLVSLQPRGSTGAAVGAAAEELGIEVHYVSADGVSVRGALLLFRELRRLRPHILHTHGYKATILTGAFGLAANYPCVSTVHAEASQAHVRKLWPAMEARLLRRFRAIAAVSPAIRDELVQRGVAPDLVRIVANGIEDPAVGPAGSCVTKPFHPTLVFVGRLAPEKNLHIALQSVARLRRQHEGIGLVIAGEGPLRAELAELARQLGIDQAVQFHGHVNDVVPLLRQADCFVLPSRTEGVPIALLEAMAVGTPIVASAVGGIPAVVSKEAEAILVRPGEADDLVTAIQKVVDSPAVAATLKNAARSRYLAAFTAERLASDYADLYDSVDSPTGKTAARRG
jgi:glycosyltransferase involved in cell wall biosynthesis